MFNTKLFDVMYKEPEKHDPVLRKKENSITANTQMTHMLELAD